jgi:hypothetical protein
MQKRFIKTLPSPLLLISDMKASNKPTELKPDPATKQLPKLIETIVMLHRSARSSDYPEI